MNFETYTKLWPHQLDLLNGPLLEDDDDDDIVDNSVSSLQSEVLSESSVNEALSDDFVPINVDCIKTENSGISLECNLIDVFTKKKNFHSLNKGALGTLVYIGNKGEAAKESDEDVDIETVDEETEISFNKRHSSHFSRISQGSNNVLQIQSRDLSTSQGQIQSVEQNVTICRSSHDEHDAATNCATVLQANDVDSLLEKFEASEEITSQEIKSQSSPKRRLMPSSGLEFSSFSQCLSSPESSKQAEVGSTYLQNADIYSKSGKNGSSPDVKDISPHIIQKIRMASTTKKGSILITPPVHKRKPRSKCSHPNSSEMKRNNRSVVPTNIIASTPRLKPTITSCSNTSILLDHDYCSTSLLDSSKKHESVKSFKNSSSCSTLPETNGDCFGTLSEKQKNLISAMVETNFVPDAQVEIEIVDSMANVEGHATLVKEYLCVSEMRNSIKKIADFVKPTLDKNNCNVHLRNDISENNKKGETVLATNKPAAKPYPSKFTCKSPSRQCSENKLTPFSHSPEINHRKILMKDKDSDISTVHTQCNRSPVWGKRLLGDFCNSRSPSPSKRFCSKGGTGPHSPPWSPKSNSRTEDDMWTSPRPACVDNNGRNFWKSEKQKQIEERRVVYVGKILEGTTVGALRDRFVNFGPIQDISVHFRDSGDNYGFVTFFDRNDAYEVVERGNRDPKLRNFDLCFGGRRQFCKTRYSDLDFSNEDRMSWSSEKNDFDTLLQKAKASAQIMRRQSVLGQ